MSRLIDVPSGGDTDIQRICEVHGWASLSHPKELHSTPDECPDCWLSDRRWGQQRYWELTARGLTCDSRGTA